MEIQLEKKWYKDLGDDTQSQSLQAILTNQTEAYQMWEYEETILFPLLDGEESDQFLAVAFEGYECIQGGACLYLNDYYIPVGAKLNMPVKLPNKIKIKLKVLGYTAIQMETIRLSASTQPGDLAKLACKPVDVLVIVPEYPSTDNLYLAAFAHARNREYIRAGLNIQVAVITDEWYQMFYEIDGIPVFRGKYCDLKQILESRIAKVLIVHFVSEEYLQIFDGYIRDERLIFICHGPETTFDILPDKARPYFTEHRNNEAYQPLFAQKRMLVKRYAMQANTTWVFVSEWLRECSEQLLDVSFTNSAVIHNVINEKLFPYQEKTKEDRKKIVLIRRFDNVSYHSVDQSVLAIRELSRREYFDQLSFHIYGDGNYFEQLLEPIRAFSNVHIHQGFVPNDKIADIYKENGILLIPSRHDAHAVAMGEAAASGLVVVGSKVTSNPYFMDEQVNHTLADPENPIELADIIERMYQNPEEFLQISKRLSKVTVSRCCIANTIGKEVQLIQEKMAERTVYQEIPKPKAPILTIVVAAYNVEQYVEKCLYTLTNHTCNDKLQILFINDGSTDRTLQRAYDFIRTYKKLNICIIDKQNGGHGSVINKGIEAADGKYFRLVDGDDWVNSWNLERQIRLLEHIDVDLMLTKGCYEYVESSKWNSIVAYDALREGMVYHFEDLVFGDYGFKEYGPVLSTSTYRTKALQRAGFHISENMPYVDMEFNAYS